MKKITLFVSSLLLCMSAMAQQESTHGTRMTPEALNTATEEIMIAIECTQAYDGGHSTFFNGTGVRTAAANFSTANIFAWEPAGDGTFYIRKAYPAEGETNVYMGKNNVTTWTTKEQAEQFKANVVDNDVADMFAGYASDDQTYSVRLATKTSDYTKWFNYNGYVYNSGAGVWTVLNVYQVATITINEVKDGETKSTVAFNKSVTEATYNIPTYDDYTYTVASEDIEIAADAASFTANNAKDVTVTVTYAPMGEDTGIESINAQQNAVVYDLTGRRVQNVEKGIYIVNGRKVVIK